MRYVDVSDLEDKIKEQANKIKELKEELNALKAQMMSGFDNLRRGTGVLVFDLDKGNIGEYDE